MDMYEKLKENPQVRARRDRHKNCVPRCVRTNSSWPSFRRRVTTSVSAISESSLPEMALRRRTGLNFLPSWQFNYRRRWIVAAASRSPISSAGRSRSPARGPGCRSRRRTPQETNRPAAVNLLRKGGLHATQARCESDEPFVFPSCFSSFPLQIECWVDQINKRPRDGPPPKATVNHPRL